MSNEQEKIEVQDELERFMQLHKFKNLQEVLELPAGQLLKMDGFGYRMLEQITHNSK